MVHGHDVDRFNRMAPHYERHWLQHFVFEPVQRTVLELAQESVANPAAILDVGCGTGRLLRSAQMRFPSARLEGVDAAAEMIKQAQTAALDGNVAIRFQQAVAENLPFPDGTFGLVFSTLTFHHWQDPSKGIAEIARVLAPGGRWLIADVMPTGWLRLVFRLFRVHQFLQLSDFDAAISQVGLHVTAQRNVPGLGGQLRVVAVGRL